MNRRDFIQILGGMAVSLAVPGTVMAKLVRPWSEDQPEYCEGKHTIKLVLSNIEVASRENGANLYADHMVSGIAKTKYATLPTLRWQLTFDDPVTLKDAIEVVKKNLITQYTEILQLKCRGSARLSRKL